MSFKGPSVWRVGDNSSGVFSGSFLCVCLSVIISLSLSFFIGTRVIGLRPTSVTSFYQNYLFIGCVSKLGHILRYMERRGLGLQHVNFVARNPVMAINVN